MMDMEEAVDILSFFNCKRFEVYDEHLLKNNSYIVNILSFLCLLAKAGTDLLSHNMACR